LHSNLSSAVHQIGLKEVNRVVNLSLARQLFARDLYSYGISAYYYWSDSIAAALLMEGLAKHLGLDAEDAYTLGILHAIGRILINRVVEEKGFSIYWDGRQPIEDWERGAVGVNFTEAGAMLLEHWRFPSSTCDAIRWQLDPEKAVEQETLLGSLQFAQRLLALTGSDFESKDWKLPEEDPFVRASGLTSAAVLQIVSACRYDFQRTLQTVELN
jgi:HD-like signal output (HDOD) protein